MRAKERLGLTCPRDIEFSQTLQTRKLYGGDRLAKARHLLERLEDASGHKEEVVYEGLQIEHIMPQTLTDEWKSSLGPDWENGYASLLDTLGNLTMTGFNPELSNLSFSEKRAIYAESHIEITKEVARSVCWTEAEIRKRAAELTDRALEIWPYFGSAAEGTGIIDTVPE